MKIYEKPMAIVNKFEVEDVIAESVLADVATEADFAAAGITDTGVQGVVFQW